MNSQNLNINAYNYHLPKEKIAFFPCKNRDESKLLVYKNGTISETVFKQIPDYLDDNCMLVFNDTKVIQARIVCFKPTGSRIELFCLEPYGMLHSVALAAKGSCKWKCFVGNNKRFTEPLTLEFNHKNENGVLHIEKTDILPDTSFEIKFSWTPKELFFSEVLERVGKTPLPPYIRRDTTDEDTHRYQTVFAKEKGSVAAPTAGLHFTDEVLEKIRQKNIPIDSITLHVGAGTFKPVTETCIENHIMHAEQFSFTKETVTNLLKNSNKKIIAVGTTTARALESLFWIGEKLSSNFTKEGDLHIPQWHNQNPAQLTVTQSLETVLFYMNQHKLNSLHASTSLMVTPHYKPKIVKGIITNFHQPKSTLLLLISAFVGDKWKEIYQYALDNDFRFLSYGDACLFW